MLIAFHPYWQRRRAAQRSLAAAHPPLFGPDAPRIAATIVFAALSLLLSARAAWLGALTIPGLFVLVRPDGSINQAVLTDRMDELHAMIDAGQFEDAIEHVHWIQRETGRSVEILVTDRYGKRWMDGYDYIEQAMGTRLTKPVIDVG